MTWLLIALGFLQPHVDLVVTTYSGEVYVIGRGDDCAAAWQYHGPFPADWREVACVRAVARTHTARVGH